MRLTTTALAFLLATAALADTITLRNGRVINGTYLGGTARTIRVDDGVNVRTVDIADVARIEFSGDANESSNRPSTAPSDRPTLRRAEPVSSPDPDADRPTLRRSESANSDPDRPTIRRPENVMRPEESSTQASGPSGTLSAGTNLVIRMIDAIDSETNRAGQTFRASIDQPIMLDGQTVVPRGADAVVRLTDAKESGKLTGRTELAVALQSIRINGHYVDINTQTINKESGSQGQKTAKVAGGTAVAGAIIGAIAGGGKGAAIGAGAGAAAGAGSQVVLGGQRVRIPSETRLTFVLDSPLTF